MKFKPVKMHGYCECCLSENIYKTGEITSKCYDCGAEYKFGITITTESLDQVLKDAKENLPKLLKQITKITIVDRKS